MIVLFRFYLEGMGNPFWEEKYKLGAVPPVPRKGEKIALAEDVYIVVDTPTHYFERTHEVALTLKLLSLVEEEGKEKENIFSPTQPATNPRDVNGVCLYCGDTECPGGEECPFYDGTLG